MNSKKSIVALAKETIAIESLAIAQLAEFIDDSFAEAVELILQFKRSCDHNWHWKERDYCQQNCGNLKFNGHPVSVYACRRRHSWRFRTASYGTMMWSFVFPKVEIRPK